MIKEDLATMGPAKLSDVEKAQQEFVKICRGWRPRASSC